MLVKATVFNGGKQLLQNCMSLENKKISPQALILLKEALAVIFWKKENLRQFLNYNLERSAIVVTLDWNLTKREIVKELIERMINRQDLYGKDLVNLLVAASDFTDFSHLAYWDDRGDKTTRAKEAVEKLRRFTKGYIQITKEKEEAQKRRVQQEKKIAKNASLEQELNDLRLEFQILATNKNKQERGFQLEGFLNKLFHLFELDPTSSFKNKGEQIDGAFTYDGTDYLLEAKWKQQVNRGELAAFCFKVENKLKISMGLFVTIEGLTPEAIDPHFNSIIVMDGADIMAIVESRVSLPDLLYKKRRKATETGNIYITYDQLLK